MEVHPNVPPVPPAEMAEGVMVSKNPVYRTVTWTPKKEYAGTTQTVCFEAHDENDVCCGEGGCVSEKTCVDIQVIGSAPEYVYPPTAAEDSILTAHVGCDLRSSFQCHEEQYCVKIEPSEASTVPVGADLEPCVYPTSLGEGEKACQTCTRDLSWKPARGQEGFKYSLCLTCSEDVAC